MSDDGSRDEELLRRALRDEADRVLPSHDALARIRERTARRPFWRAPLVVGLAGGVLTATTVIAGGVVLLDGPAADNTVTGPSDDTRVATATPTSPAPDTSGTGDPSPPVSTAPETTSPGTPVAIENVPVYYVTEVADGSLRLAREFRDVEAPDGPVVAAVKTMLAEPPHDPDYEALWSAATDVKSVHVDDDVIEVDLTGSADYTGVTDDVALLATQELVYTVTAALADSSPGGDGARAVRVLLDGEPIDKVWGNVDVSEPVERAPQVDVRQLVQINNPGEGAAVGRSFTVDGDAAVFEATVQWQILDDAGNEVQGGFTTAKTCCEFSPFEFSVELEPGTYTVLVSESDPSGGAEGRPPMSDSRTFTVE
jgi:hypothetical protein